ncbi:MAG TPA: PQQ-binding-like beta-propeller repeat protein [Actinomycetota bacterium]|nr:PQQ-binding-like beta-propeller repeat protein [Actinomycetota bacterium]
MSSSPRRSKIIAALAALTACVSLLPAAAHSVTCAAPTVYGGDWRQIANQPTGDRVQDQERRLDPLSVALMEPAWTFDANRWTLMQNNEITGYPIVADGCVYAGSSLATFGTSGWVFAINADTGELVWRTKTKGGVYSTVAVDDGKVYAFVSRVSSPYVVALDQRDGSVIWERTVDFQVGSDAVSSPVVYDGMVWVGISGTAAEVNEGDRSTFQGNQVLLDATTGQLLKKTYTIPEEDWKDPVTGDTFSGGAVWSTISVDPQTSYGYVGTGNPFDYDNEYPTTNSILKMDLARARTPEGAPIPSPSITNPSFGKIVGSYKGEVEEYFPETAESAPCQEMEEISGLFAAGLECLQLDLDFGAMPNIFTDATGRKLVGAGQKSGVYHAVDAETMKPVWKSLLGVPSPVGGIVGSAAYDGKNLYGPHTIGSYLWSIKKNDGGLNWVAPVGSGINWGPPVTYANRILFTVDLAGFLDAYGINGEPLLHRPLMLGSDTRERLPLSWGGVTVARGMAFVSAGVGLTSAGLPSLPSGFVIAFRPGRIPTP